ncbi:MAG: aspartate/glutamate racemase family protein [Spirochaetaceae bacterium]|nr:aspartate/glutamate racemase family protein [Spirochaetaceae bacterium]
MIIKGGPNIYGTAIGVLSSESYYYKLPGHIKNTTTFDFPVTYKVIKGAFSKVIVEQKGAGLIDSFIEGAKELEKEGVKAITASCGFTVLFQDKLASAVNIPVFTSSLLQIPFAHKIIRKDQKVGVLVASQKSFTIEHLKAVGAENVPVCVAGMDGKQEFSEVIIEKLRLDLDIIKLEQEVLGVVKELFDNNPIGALVIECTDLPPFSYKIQQMIKKPVFDIATLTKYAYNCVMQPDYQKDGKYDVVYGHIVKE